MRKSSLLLILVISLTGRGFAKDPVGQPSTKLEGNIAFDKVLDIVHGGRTYRLQLHNVNHILSPDFRFLLQVSADEAAKAKGTAEIFEQVSPVTNHTMYYIVNPEVMTKCKPDLFFGKVEGRDGWSVSAIQDKDRLFSGHVYSSRGLDFQFSGFGAGEGTDPSSSKVSMGRGVSMEMLVPFYLRCLGGSLERADMYRADLSTPDVLEYDLVLDSTFANYGGLARWEEQCKRSSVEAAGPKEAYLGKKIQGMLNSMFASYIDVAAVHTRDSLLLPRLKTVVYRTDEKEDAFPDKASLKWSLKAMWSKDHDKGITICGKFGSANAVRGGFSCQVRRIGRTLLHEHNHCLGPQHQVAGMPELVCPMTGGGKRVQAPTALVMRNDCKKDERGFSRVAPVDFGLPPCATLDLTSVKRGQKTPLVIDVLSNDFVSSGAAIELVEVESSSSRGQSVKINNGRVEYTAPADWVGLDNFHYTIRAKACNGWLYAKGLVAVEVRSWVGRYEAEELVRAENAAAATDAPSQAGCFGDGYAVLKAQDAAPLAAALSLGDGPSIYMNGKATRNAYIPDTKAPVDNATAAPMKWTVKTSHKGRYGFGIRYHRAEGALPDDPELEVVVAGKTIRLTAPLEIFGTYLGGTKGLTPRPARYDRITGKQVSPEGYSVPNFNMVQWGILKVSGLELPAGEHEVKLRVLKGRILIDTIYLEEGLNVQVNFEPVKTSRMSQPHFFVDVGEPLDSRPYTGGRFTYGWSQQKSDAMSGGMMAGSNRMLSTSILLGSDTWSIELPNGDYHVSVFCGDPNNRLKQLNNIQVNGKNFDDRAKGDGYVLQEPRTNRHDPLTPILDFDGNELLDPLDYIALRVSVENGKLEIKKGLGSRGSLHLLNPSLSYIEIAEIVDDSRN